MVEHIFGVSHLLYNSLHSNHRRANTASGAIGRAFLICTSLCHNEQPTISSKINDSAFLNNLSKQIKCKLLGVCLCGVRAACIEIIIIFPGIKSSQYEVKKFFSANQISNEEGEKILY